MVTGGRNQDKSAERSIEVHDMDGKFRCESSDYLLLPAIRHTQTAYEYTAANQSNYLKFQVCGGLNYDASLTCQTYDDETKVLSPSLNTSRRAHVSYSSRAYPCSSTDPCLILMGGQITPNATEMYRPPSDRFNPYLDVTIPIEGQV